MERRYSLQLLALFFMLSQLLLLLLLLPLSVSAVPLSRSLALKNQNSSSPAGVIANQAVPAAKQERNNPGDETARMAIEVNDYPGSGANPRHDPRSPGRA